MDRLSDDAKAILDRARPHFSPTPEQLAKLGARLQSSPPDPGGGGGSGIGLGAKAKGVLTVVGGTLVTILIAGGLAMMRPASAEPAFARRILNTPPLDTELSPPSWTPAPLALPDPSETQVAEEPVPSNTFSAELRLITTARRALLDKHFSKATKTAQTYLRRFAAGSFREEAHVLELLAQCEQDLQTIAVARAQEYLASSSPAFAARVREACLKPNRE